MAQDNIKIYTQKGSDAEHEKLRTQEAADKADLEAKIAKKADDNAVVHLEGEETITAKKTFRQGAVVNSTLTADNVVVNTSLKLSKEPHLQTASNYFKLPAQGTSDAPATIATKSDVDTVDAKFSNYYNKTEVDSKDTAVKNELNQTISDLTQRIEKGAATAEQEFNSLKDQVSKKADQTALESLEQKVATKATDSDVIHKSGGETISGALTINGNLTLGANKIQANSGYYSFPSAKGTDSAPATIAVGSDFNEYYKKSEVESKLNSKQDTLTFDDTPNQASSNPVKSSGIYTALQSKADSSQLSNYALKTDLSEYAKTTEVDSKDTAVKNELTTKIDDLDRRMQEGANTAQTEFESLKTQVQGKAEQSALDDLKSTVDQKADKSALDAKADESALAAKQDKLVSGVNIAKINNKDLLTETNIIIEGGGEAITIDDQLKDSTNPVQNKVINEALQTKLDKLGKHSSINVSDLYGDDKVGLYYYDMNDYSSSTGSGQEWIDEALFVGKLGNNAWYQIGIVFQAKLGDLPANTTVQLRHWDKDTNDNGGWSAWVELALKDDLDDYIKTSTANDRFARKTDFNDFKQSVEEASETATTEFNNLKTKVETKANQSDLTALQTKVDGKADSSTVSELSTKVINVESQLGNKIDTSTANSTFAKQSELTNYAKKTGARKVVYSVCEFQFLGDAAQFNEYFGVAFHLDNKTREAEVIFLNISPDENIYVGKGEASNDENNQCYLLQSSYGDPYKPHIYRSIKNEDSFVDIAIDSKGSLKQGQGSNALTVELIAAGKKLFSSTEGKKAILIEYQEAD